MPDHDAPRNPFEGVADYFSELNRMRNTGTHGQLQPPEDRHRTHASAWVPTTDIYARGEDLVIELELAGVSPEDVSLGFAHGTLTVSGQRRSSEQERGDNSYYVRERIYGEFRRTIMLPDGIDPARISAVFDEGLVEVTVRGALGGADTSHIELEHRSGTPTTRSLG